MMLHVSRRSCWGTLALHKWEIEGLNWFSHGIRTTSFSSKFLYTTYSTCAPVLPPLTVFFGLLTSSIQLKHTCDLPSPICKVVSQSTLPVIRKFSCPSSRRCNILSVGSCNLTFARFSLLVVISSLVSLGTICLMIHVFARKQRYIHSLQCGTILFRRGLCFLLPHVSRI